MMEHLTDSQLPVSEGLGGTGVPQLSVVMPVRNAMPFLKTCIQSILTQSFRDFGAVRLWAGGSPAVLQPLLAQGPFNWNFRTLRTLVWASWGSLNPASLRAFGRWAIRTRDFLATLSLKDGRPCEWR